MGCGPVDLLNTVSYINIYGGITLGEHHTFFAIDVLCTFSGRNVLTTLTLDIKINQHSEIKLWMCFLSFWWTMHVTNLMQFGSCFVTDKTSKKNR